MEGDDFADIKARVEGASIKIRIFLEKLTDKEFWDYFGSERGTDDLQARVEKALDPYLSGLLDSTRRPMVRKEKRWNIYTAVAAIRDAVVLNMQDPDKGAFVNSVFQDIKKQYKERVKNILAPRPIF